MAGVSVQPGTHPLDDGKLSALRALRQALYGLLFGDALTHCAKAFEHGLVHGDWAMVDGALNASNARQAVKDLAIAGEKVESTGVNSQSRKLECFAVANWASEDDCSRCFNLQLPGEFACPRARAGRAGQAASRLPNLRAQSQWAVGRGQCKPNMEELCNLRDATRPLAVHLRRATQQPVYITLSRRCKEVDEPGMSVLASRPATGRFGTSAARCARPACCASLQSAAATQRRRRQDESPGPNHQGTRDAADAEEPKRPSMA